MILADVDVTDLPALEAGHIGDGTHDIAGLHAVRISDLDTENLCVFVGQPIM